MCGLTASQEQDQFVDIMVAGVLGWRADTAEQYGEQLRTMAPELKRQVMVRSVLYVIEQIHPMWARKITGMLLEYFETTALIHLIHNPTEMQAWSATVLECLDIKTIRLQCGIRSWRARRKLEAMR